MFFEKYQNLKKERKFVIKEAREIKENIIRCLSYYSGKQIETNIAFTSAENSLLLAIEELLYKYEQQTELIANLQKELSEIKQKEQNNKDYER